MSWVTGILAQPQQSRVRQRDDAFLERFALGGDSEFDIHRIGVADGDAGLQPVEMHLPHAAKGVGPRLEFTEVIEHLG